MLPQLSCLSVSSVPEGRLRLRRSSRYQRISPLHREFHLPLPHSSTAVSNAVPRMIRGISHSTRSAAYAPFTPSKSEQRSPPLYYRGCWHRVSRGFLLRYYHVALVLTTLPCPRKTVVYNPKAGILHAASLRQSFPHCERFSTAASRRSLGSVSVPVRLTILSDQLPVSLGEPLPHQQADRTRAPPQAPGLTVPSFTLSRMPGRSTSGISPTFAELYLT